MSTSFPFESRSAWRESAWDVPIVRNARFECLEQIDVETSIYAGQACEHAEILALLEQAGAKRRFHDFSSRLDEPGYQPSDRLLMRRRGALVGHLHVAHRVAWFADVRVPVARFSDLELWPEFEQGRYAHALLDLAEAQARREGAIVAMAYASRPALLEDRGWRVGFGQGHTRAATRAVLAHLELQRAPREVRFSWDAPRPSLGVSAWRQIELDDVRRLYDSQFSHGRGATVRSEQAWHWLLGRGAHDLVLVVHEQARVGSDDKRGVGNDDKHGVGNDDGCEQRLGKIYGYAVLRDSNIVEMAVDSSCTAARPLLLAAACREALDRGHRHMTLHAPANEPLHELLVTAGGAWMPGAATSGGCWMVKLLAGEKWARRMFDLWHERARNAGIVRPLQFDLIDPRGARRFSLSRRSANVQPTTVRAARWFSGTPATLDALLMGDLTLPDAVERGELKVSDPLLLDEWRTVTLPHCFWQSPLELLRLR